MMSLLLERLAFSEAFVIQVFSVFSLSSVLLRSVRAVLHIYIIYMLTGTRNVFLCALLLILEFLVALFYNWRFLLLLFCELPLLSSDTVTPLSMKLNSQNSLSPSLNVLPFILHPQESVCASFGAGLSSACVVDVGDSKASVCCIEDGVSLEQTRLVIS